MYSSVIISQTYLLCQVLFLTFQNFFRAFFAPAFATLLYYHISFTLSIPFLKNFSLFFYFLNLIPKSPPIYYIYEEFCQNQRKRALYCTLFKFIHLMKDTFYIQSQQKSVRLFHSSNFCPKE